MEARQVFKVVKAHHAASTGASPAPCGPEQPPPRGFVICAPAPQLWSGQKGTVECAFHMGGASGTAGGRLHAQPKSHSISLLIGVSLCQIGSRTSWPPTPSLPGCDTAIAIRYLAQSLLEHALMIERGIICAACRLVRDYAAPRLLRAHGLPHHLVRDRMRCA